MARLKSLIAQLIFDCSQEKTKIAFAIYLYT